VAQADLALDTAVTMSGFTGAQTLTVGQGFALSGYGPRLSVEGVG